MALATWKKGLSVLASAGAIGVLLAGCGTNTGNAANIGTTTNQQPGTTTGSAGKPNEGGTVTLDTDSTFKDFDPALAYFQTDYEVVPQIYEQLVTYQGSAGNIVSQLAQKWEITDGGKTYTFHLRKGVKFTNGDAMTAQSFVDEFERILGKDGINSPGEGFLDPIVVGSTAYHNLKNKTGASVKGITAPDPYTLVIKLNQPEPFFLEVLAMPFFSAVDEKYIKQVGNAAFDSSKMMGTGPFLASNINANGVTLKKNTNYWGKDAQGNKLPYLDQVNIRINKNQQVDALNFQSGTTGWLGSLMNGVPASSYPKFITDPTLKNELVRKVENSNYYLGMNNKMAPFTDKKLRVALEYAIDKNKLVKLTNGRHMVADQNVPPGIQGYVKDLPANVKYTYDPAKAKALLKAAGYKPGQLNITLYSQNTGVAAQWDNVIQNNLQQIGINCKIQQYDSNTFYTKAMAGQLPFFIAGWNQDFPDAWDFLMLGETNQAPANNMAQYSNKQYDTWVEQAKTMTNQAERNALFRKATIQFLADAPWIPLTYPTRVDAVQPWVHGYYISPVLEDPLNTIWLDKDHIK